MPWPRGVRTADLVRAAPELRSTPPSTRWHSLSVALGVQGMCACPEVVGVKEGG